MIRNFLLIGIGGGIGSMLRYGASLLVGQKTFPLATLLINIIGSFIIGLVIAAALKQDINNNWKLFLATGICGGFTTFSAFSLENLQLLQNERYGLFVLYLALSIVGGLAAVWCGFKLIQLQTN